MNKILLHLNKPLFSTLFITVFLIAIAFSGYSCCCNCGEDDVHEDGFSESGIDLLNRYAPVLYFHEEEQYFPTVVDTMLERSNLVNEVLIEGPISQAYLMAYNDEHNALQLWDIDPLSFDPYQKNVYARKIDNSESEFIGLQYWFFYTYNTHERWNDHEGDWEMITILIERESGKPKLLIAQQHMYLMKYDYEQDIEKQDGPDGKHPVIYVAKGIHSSWASSGDNSLFNIILPGWICRWLSDRTMQSSQVLYPEGWSSDSIYNLHEIDEADQWIDWRGKWGVDGISGPSQNPSWNLLEPGFRLEFPSMWVGESCSPVNLHVYDEYGNHVGLTPRGEIETNIPGTYLYSPSEDEEEYVIILTEEKLNFKVVATDVGSFDLVLFQYLSPLDTKMELIYQDVPITENSIATINPSESNIMRLDYYGNGTRIYNIKPVMTFPPYTFYWSENSDAIRYEITLSEDPTFTIIEWSYNVDQPFYKPDEPLTYSTKYYWRVRAITGEPYYEKGQWVTPSVEWIRGQFTTSAAGSNIDLEFKLIPSP